VDPSSSVEMAVASRPVLYSVHGTAGGGTNRPDPDGDPMPPRGPGAAAHPHTVSRRPNAAPPRRPCRTARGLRRAVARSRRPRKRESPPSIVRRRRIHTRAVDHQVQIGIVGVSLPCRSQISGLTDMRRGPIHFLPACWVHPVRSR
jgi:hypothetical protein